MTKQYYLMPTSGQKSFGRKAVIKQDNDIQTLYSYETKIMSMNLRAGEMVRYWPTDDSPWTMTTGKHIASFCGLKKADFLKIKEG